VKRKRARDIEDLYLTDEYVLKNPSLHVEDTPWKVSKVRHFLYGFMKNYKEIFMLKTLNIGTS